jgi:hypothetical protein
MGPHSLRRPALVSFRVKCLVLIGTCACARASAQNGPVAVVDPSGLVKSVPSLVSECVRVDAPSSCPCGIVFVDGERPSGPINGSNNVFTLSAAPLPPSSLQLYRNGLLQRQPDDYSVALQTITFVAASVPQPGDIIQAFYRIATSGSSTPSPNASLQATVLKTVPRGMTTDYETFDRQLQVVAQQARLLASAPPSADSHQKTSRDDLPSEKLLQKYIPSALDRSLIIDTDTLGGRNPAAATNRARSQGVTLLFQRLNSATEPDHSLDKLRSAHDVPHNQRVWLRRRTPGQSSDLSVEPSLPPSSDESHFSQSR